MPATEPFFLNSGAYLAPTFDVGAWVPELFFTSSGTTGLVFITRVGTWTRLGNQVTANFVFELSAIGAANGLARIRNFPFFTEYEPGSGNNYVVTAGAVSEFYSFVGLNSEPFFVGIGPDPLIVQISHLDAVGEDSTGLDQTHFTAISVLAGAVQYNALPQR